MVRFQGSRSNSSGPRPIPNANWFDSILVRGPARSVLTAEMPYGQRDRPGLPVQSWLFKYQERRSAPPRTRIGRTISRARPRGRRRADCGVPEDCGGDEDEDYPEKSFHPQPQAAGDGAAQSQPFSSSRSTAGRHRGREGRRARRAIRCRTRSPPSRRRGRKAKIAAASRPARDLPKRLAH